MPIHTSKLSAYLLETKHTEHIMAASHFPTFKSISLPFFCHWQQRDIQFIFTQKDHSLLPVSPNNTNATRYTCTGKVYPVIVLTSVEFFHDSHQAVNCPIYGEERDVVLILREVTFNQQKMSSLTNVLLTIY